MPAAAEVDDSRRDGAVGVLVLIVLAMLYYQRGSSPTRAQPAASPAPVKGQTIDGIRCETMEQALFHLHAHLAIYAAGQPRRVPYGIGIRDANVQQTPQGPFVATARASTGSTRTRKTGDPRGITRAAHVHAGDYFDIWGQPLSPSRVGSDTGPMIAYVNGQRYEGDLRAITLGAHAVIQLDVGSDLPPAPYSFQPEL